MLAGYKVRYGMFLILCCSASVAPPLPGSDNNKVLNTLKKPCSTAGLSNMFKSDDLIPIVPRVQW